MDDFDTESRREERKLVHRVAHKDRVMDGCSCAILSGGLLLAMSMFLPLVAG